MANLIFKTKTNTISLTCFSRGVGKGVMYSLTVHGVGSACTLVSLSELESLHAALDLLLREA